MTMVLGETVISRADAARLLRCPVEAVGRFMGEGDADGARLEAAEVRGRWVTSVEAVYRFARDRYAPFHQRAGRASSPASWRGEGPVGPSAPGWVCALFLGMRSPAAVGSAVAAHPLFDSLFEEPWRRGLLAFAQSLPASGLAALAAAAADDALAEQGAEAGAEGRPATRAGAAFLRHLNRRLLGAKTRADTAAREATAVALPRP
jgi:hypothetical protein